MALHVCYSAWSIGIGLDKLRFRFPKIELLSNKFQVEHKNIFAIKFIQFEILIFYDRVLFFAVGPAVASPRIHFICWHLDKQ